VLTVDILPCRSAEGWWTVKASSPERGLIVMTPECDTLEGARQLARAMWQSRELVLPAGCPPYGHA
jgi:hypothetical protein